VHQVGGSKSQTQVAICASSEQCSMSRPEQWAIGTFRVQHDLKRSYLLYHISPSLFFALRNFCHGPFYKQKVCVQHAAIRAEGRDA
jgi:hypothetical protein